MKLVLLVLLSVLSLAYAADIEKVTDTGGRFARRVRDVPPFSTVTQMENYIPEYGYQVNTYLSKTDATFFDLRLLVEALKLLVVDYGQFVEGLDAEDWVSISADVSAQPITYLTVRSKPSVEGSLEVWIDGVRRPEYE